MLYGVIVDIINMKIELILYYINNCVLIKYNFQIRNNNDVYIFVP